MAKPTKIKKTIEDTLKWAEKQDAKVKAKGSKGNPIISETLTYTHPEPAAMDHQVGNHPPATFTNKVGRPTKYTPEMCDAVKLLASKGLTDIELAKGLMISEATLNNWKIEFPEFLESINDGKGLIDDMVEKSLLNRAMGCSILETKVHITKEGDVIETEIDKHLEPNVAAQIFWLKNRRSKIWRDKHEVDFTNPLTIQMGEADQKTL